MDTVSVCLFTHTVRDSITNIPLLFHQTGAAIAVMDAVFLRQHLDPSVTISTTVFGLPRGGNQAWANFVDQNVRLCSTMCSYIYF
jgi:Lipase (class 3)